MSRMIHWPIAAFLTTVILVPSLAAQPVNTATTTNAATTANVYARLLDTFEQPTEIMLDPVEDNTETEAVVRALKKALERRGIRISDEAQHVLEITVDPAYATGVGLPWEQRRRPDERPAASAEHYGPLRQLYPTDELTPKPDRERNRVGPIHVPRLAVTLNFYQRAQAPIWIATAIDRRDRRALEVQSVDLGLDAFAYFGRSSPSVQRSEQ